MIRAGLAIFLCYVALFWLGDQDMRAEERQAAHVAQRSKVIAERQANLESDEKWAALQLQADEVWTAKMARK